MKKPIMKKEVAVDTVATSVRAITFYSTQDASIEFEQFGRLKPLEGYRDEYLLIVDARFDLQEVLAYIEAYGDES